MKLRTNGTTISYRLDGPEGAPVVTLSHSLATSSAMWAPQVSAFASRFRVLAYDTRGHGESEVPPAPYSLSDLVADLHGLLTGLGIDRTSLVGLSMGGTVAQLFALEHPEMLHGLVLANTNARSTADAAAMWDERVAVALAQGMGAHVEPTIARWFTAAFIEDHPEVVGPVRELIRSTDPAGYAGCIGAIRNIDFLDRLSELRMPALVIGGREDTGLPGTQAVHERIEGSELVVLSPAKHLCNLERPAAFNDAVLGFLDRL